MKKRDEYGEKPQLDRKARITSFKPTAWGKGTEHVSEDVDEILYG